MTLEEKVVKLEKELAEVKAELAKKNESKSLFIPKVGDKYVYISHDGNIAYTKNNGCNVDINIIGFNNAFPNTENTMKHLEWYRDNVLKVQNKLMQLHELLCPDYIPDWNNKYEDKYFIYLSHEFKEWRYSTESTANIINVYFNEEAAIKACEILNREKFMIK